MMALGVAPADLLPLAEDQLKFIDAETRADRVQAHDAHRAALLEALVEKRAQIEIENPQLVGKIKRIAELPRYVRPSRSCARVPYRHAYHRGESDGGVRRGRRWDGGRARRDAMVSVGYEVFIWCSIVPHLHVEHRRGFVGNDT